MEDVIKQVESISLAGMTQPELVEHLISSGCEYLGIKLPTPKRIGAASPDWRRKRYLIVLLSDYTILSQHEIASLLGYKQHGTVSFHYKNMKDELSDNTYSSNKSKLVYNNLLNYLKLQEK
jgi:hypothetical protein